MGGIQQNRLLDQLLHIETKQPSASHGVPLVVVTEFRLRLRGGASFSFSALCLARMVFPTLPSNAFPGRMVALFIACFRLTYFPKKRKRLLPYWLHCRQGCHTGLPSSNRWRERYSNVLCSYVYIKSSWNFSIMISNNTDFASVIWPLIMALVKSTKGGGCEDGQTCRLSLDVSGTSYTKYGTAISQTVIFICC